jgi:hypothetical protein
MSIDWKNDRIVIWDDHAPSRQPLILPAGTPDADVIAAHADYQSPAEPPPDWLGFASWLMNYPPMAAAMESARASTEPQGEPVTSSLPALVAMAQDGDCQPFAANWPQFLAAAGAPAETLQPIVAQALACHLPAEFVAALTPGPTE